MFQNEAVTSLIKFNENEKVTDMLLLTYSMNLRLLNEVILQSGIVNQYENTQKGVNTLLTHITCCMQADRAVRQATLAQEKQFRYAYLALAKGRVAMVPYKGQSFHPKVWAFLYTKTVKGTLSPETWLRLVVGSRNITGQNMLEGFLCLEGKVGSFPPQGQPANPNQALLDLLKAARAEFVPPQPNNQKLELTSAQRIYSAIETTDFLPCIQQMLGTVATGTAAAQKDVTASYKFFIPEGAYKSGAQLPQGNLNKAILASAKTATKFFAVSPFLGVDKVKAVLDGLLVSQNQTTATTQPQSDYEGLDYKIITRSKEYTQKFASAAPNVAVHYLKSTTNTPKANKEPSENDTYTFEDNEQPLHAKIYAFDAPTESHLYIGSANFSANGFDNNYEFMVKLVSQNMAFAQKLEEGLNSFNIKQCDTTYEPDNEEEQRQGLTFEGVAATGEDVQAVADKLIEENDENKLFMALHEIFTAKNKAGEKPFDYAYRCLKEKAYEKDTIKKRNRLTPPNREEVDEIICALCKRFEQEGK